VLGTDHASDLGKELEGNSAEPGDQVDLGPAMGLDVLPGRRNLLAEGAGDFLVPADPSGEGDRHPALGAGERPGGEVGNSRAGADLDLAGGGAEALVALRVRLRDRIEDTHTVIIALAVARPPYSGAKGEARSDLWWAAACNRDLVAKPGRSPNEHGLCKFRGADGGGVR
jgi:hypothetical protein